MPRIMFKPNLGRDEYVIWSTVVEGPVSGVMDRATAKEKWRAGECSLTKTPISVEEAEEDMQRTDATGWTVTEVEWSEEESIMLCNLDGYPGDADVGVFLVSDMATLTRAIDAEDWATLDSLLTYTDVMA